MLYSCDCSNKMCTCHLLLSPLGKLCRCICLWDRKKRCNLAFIIVSFSLQSHLLEFQSSLLLQSPYVVLKVRFPIPDLRPPGLRRPQSQRAVRNETLSLQISNLELKSQQGPDVQQDGPRSPGAKLTKLLEACFSDLHGEAFLIYIYTHIIYCTCMYTHCGGGISQYHIFSGHFDQINAAFSHKRDLKILLLLREFNM